MLLKRRYLIECPRRVSVITIIKYGKGQAFEILIILNIFGINISKGSKRKSQNLLRSPTNRFMLFVAISLPIDSMSRLIFIMLCSWFRTLFRFYVCMYTSNISYSYITRKRIYIQFSSISNMTNLHAPNVLLNENIVT